MDVFVIPSVECARLIATMNCGVPVAWFLTYAVAAIADGNCGSEDNDGV